MPTLQTQTSLSLSYLLKGSLAGARDCDCPCNPCDCDPCECPRATRLPRWRLSLYQLAEGHINGVPLRLVRGLFVCLALPLHASDPGSWQELILIDCSTNTLEALLPVLEEIEEHLQALPAEVRGQVARPARRAVYALPLLYEQQGTTPLLRVQFVPSEATLLRAAAPAPATPPPAWSYSGPLALRGQFSWQSTPR
jgi:hypothetical protein